MLDSMKMLQNVLLVKTDSIQVLTIQNVKKNQPHVQIMYQIVQDVLEEVIQNNVLCVIQDLLLMIQRLHVVKIQ